MSNTSRHPSSFRDSSGYIFKDRNQLKRTILPVYFKQYRALTDSGFYQKLMDAHLLIPHKEISQSDSEIIISPQHIPFISYPYEWGFLQYKEAALLTLKLQKFALQHGFSLKDATAFNVTFYKGKAVFIDTLSFDFYDEDSPWRAYKQFVMHFLGPLVLTHYHGSAALGMIQRFIDGIPLKLVASLLPFKTKLNPFLYTNIHLLAKFEAKHNEDYKPTSKQARLTKKAQLKLVTALYEYIKGLTLKDRDTEWGNYYNKINYSEFAFKQKAKQISTWVDAIKPKTVFDIGGNDGTFVRELQYDFENAIVADIDINAVDANYKQTRANKDSRILPLVLDVLSPASAIGFENKERESFLQRITSYVPDVTLALALIHHMTLSGNIPFEMSAHFFASFSKQLIIEFPKRDDSWVQRLLKSKREFEEHFDFYNEDNFETSYSEYFYIKEKKSLPESHRILYMMENRG